MDRSRTWAAIFGYKFITHIAVYRVSIIFSLEVVTLLRLNKAEKKRNSFSAKLTMSLANVQGTKQWHKWTIWKKKSLPHHDSYYQPTIKSHQEMKLQVYNVSYNFFRALHKQEDMKSRYSGSWSVTIWFRFYIHCVVIFFRKIEHAVTISPFQCIHSKEISVTDFSGCFWQRTFSLPILLLNSFCDSPLHFTFPS